MYGIGFKVVLLLHLIIFFLPIIGRLNQDEQSNEDADTTGLIVTSATIKPIWSIIDTILLLRLITDLRLHSTLARIMSHNIWHCLGKLCFAAYLIHYEVILTLLKSGNRLAEVNLPNFIRELSAVFVITVTLSYIIYIFYEAPINKLITLAGSKQVDKLKQRSNMASGIQSSRRQ
jgi:peptidoglycan/LPS O-acetylase OafA/YrhL